MIDRAQSLWLAAGLAAGLTHATMLWRSTRRPTPWTPLVGSLRLAAVTALLMVAALAGGILPAASGWLLGFAAMTVLLAAGPANGVGGSPGRRVNR